MPRSEAQKRADKKYASKTYHRYAINVRKEFVPLVDKYKEENSITSDSSVFYKAIKYCIENNIDLSDKD